MIRNKGSSTVMGALLFVIVATSIALFTFSITLEYQKRWKDYLKRQELKLSEKIEITNVENVGLDTHITVRNLGGEAAKIVAIYINHKLVKTLQDFYIPAGGDRVIILRNFNIKQNDCIKITTDRGNFATYHVPS